MQPDLETARIFVRIASYRDSECVPTIRDLFAKATHPERVFVGICYQYDPLKEGPFHCPDGLPSSQIQAINFDYRESRGSGWAWNEAQKLQQGEEFTLQVHAHSRFVEGWDNTVVQYYQQAADSDAVLTYFCPPYTPPNQFTNDQFARERVAVSALAEPQSAQIVHLQNSRMHTYDAREGLYPSPFVVFNFIFAPSSIFTRLPLDPYIYFWGEELMFSLRLWTHGYTIYQLPDKLSFHQWHQRDKTVQKDYLASNNPRNQFSLKRIRHMLGLEKTKDAAILENVEAHALGGERPLEDFWKYAGIDLQKRLVTANAKKGLWDLEILAKYKTSLTVPAHSASRIFVIIPSYQDPECQWTVKDLFDQAADPARIHVGICWQGPETRKEQIFTEPLEWLRQVHINFYPLSEAKGPNWARAEAFSLWNNEEYVLQIDSHMRFDHGWDEALIAMHTQCGSEKAVLTSHAPNYTPPRKLRPVRKHVKRLFVNQVNPKEKMAMVRLAGKSVARDAANLPYPTPILIANCVFAKATAFREVPLDPYIHFYGDELTHSARLWTHGYDLYQFTESVIYHHWEVYESSAEEFPTYKKSTHPLAATSHKRELHLLGLEYTDDEHTLKNIELYGHGVDRSLESYWQYLGVDLETQFISPHAQEGEWHLLKPHTTDTVMAQPTKPTSNKAKSAAKAAALSKIFVQIASYRDPECQWTVKDLFEKAEHPERIFVGICWQSIPEEDQDCFQIITRPAQVRITHVDARESKGACWARNLTQQLWKDEEYTMQVDSHMRFEDGWDSKLIEMHQSLPNSRSVLSTYPPGYTPPAQYGDRMVLRMIAKEFNKQGIFTMTSKRVLNEEKLKKPIPGAFVGACFLFGPSSIIEDVPYDPYLYFFGEEITLSVRLWTHGYDIYHPNIPIAYHDWKRNRRKNIHQTDSREAPALDRKSYARVHYLLEGKLPDNKQMVEFVKTEPGKYGLGKIRSLEAYEAFAGVYFKERRIEERAKRGEFIYSKNPVKAKVPVAATKPAAKQQPIASVPKPVISKSILAHQPIKTFESKEVLVFDDFLPEEQFEKLYNHVVESEYSYINTSGKVRKVWNIDNGFPLRSAWNHYYYNLPQNQPGPGLYPNNKPTDQFIESINKMLPQVKHIIGEPPAWGHYSVTAWLYPPNTGLSLHNDGSGIYSGAYVYFLNKQWRLHWGGLLLVIDTEANQKIMERRKKGNAGSFQSKKWLHESEHDDYAFESGFAQCVMPKGNRIVFIAPEAFHIVTKVLPTAGDNVRMSLAGFFARKAHMEHQAQK